VAQTPSHSLEAPLHTPGLSTPPRPPFIKESAPRHPALTKGSILDRFAKAPASSMRYAPSLITESRQGPYSVKQALSPEDGEDNGLAQDEVVGSDLRPRFHDVRGDHSLNPDLLPNGPLRPAAVLVPIILYEDDPHVLFTRRTAHLSSHAGQISFPGGRIDPGDSNAADAALRETWEEVGIDPNDIALVSRLDTYVTRTGFEISPIVGFLDPPLSLTLNPNEVAEAFEVPLSFLLDPANLRKDQMEFSGQKRVFYAFPYKDYYIWGATAGILVNLMEILG